MGKVLPWRSAAARKAPPPPSLPASGEDALQGVSASAVGGREELTRRADQVVARVRAGLLELDDDFARAGDTVEDTVEAMGAKAGASVREMVRAAREIDGLAEEQSNSGESLAERLSRVRRSISQLGETIGGLCDRANSSEPNPVEENRDHG